MGAPGPSPLGTWDSMNPAPTLVRTNFAGLKVHALSGPLIAI